MIIRSLWLQNFMSHENTTIELPENGIVVVTGTNGSGKSSIMEAISMGVWGKTLRGASPWVSGKDGCVSVAFGQNTAMRMRKGSKTSLQWAGDETKYETTRKAQNALEEIVGRFDVWRRCSVFSSHDAAHFTLASDGERKRLLESILGLGKFDGALIRCRDDLKACERQNAKLKNEINLAYNSLQYQKKHLEENVAALNSLVSMTAEEPTINVTVEKKKLVSIDAEVRAMEQEINDRVAVLAKLKADKLNADSKLSLTSQDVCFTCGQKIQESTKKAIAKEVADAQYRLDYKTKEIDSETQGLKKDLAELKEYYKDLFARIQHADSSANSQKWIDAEKAKIRLRKDSCELAVRSTEEQIERLEEDYTACAKRLAILEGCQKVLGLKGVRAHVLGTAMEGLETLANTWIERIAGDSIKLEIKPYTEKKTGGTSDAIAINVEGVGGGNGYKAASGGQRRRIDVALLLSLAELAQASQGREPGTIFFDEVFDSLDAEGIKAVSAALAEMGQNRPVVVITHSEKLAEELAYTSRIEIQDGRVL